MDGGTERSPGKPNFASEVAAHHRLTRGWSRTMLISWLAMVASVIAVGSSSHVIGRPVFWLDDQRWGVVGAVLLTTVLAVPFGMILLVAYLEGPFIPYIGGIATIELVVLGILDRHRSPGAAAVMGVLAAAGLLLTLASFGGRFRPVADSASE